MKSDLSHFWNQINPVVIEAIPLHMLFCLFTVVLWIILTTVFLSVFKLMMETGHYLNRAQPLW